MDLKAPSSSETLNHNELPYCSQFNGSTSNTEISAAQSRAPCKLFTTQDMLYPQAIL